MGDDEEATTDRRGEPGVRDQAEELARARARHPSGQGPGRVVLRVVDPGATPTRPVVGEPAPADGA
jgi:hypothetical protein